MHMHMPFTTSTSTSVAHCSTRSLPPSYSPSPAPASPLLPVVPPTAASQAFLIQHLLHPTPPSYSLPPYPIPHPTYQEKQPFNLSVTIGVTDTDTKSFSDKTGIKVSYGEEEGLSGEGVTFTTKNSVELSNEFTFTTTSSHAFSQSTTRSYPLTVPAYKAAALFIMRYQIRVRACKCMCEAWCYCME